MTRQELVAALDPKSGHLLLHRGACDFRFENSRRKYPIVTLIVDMWAPSGKLRLWKTRPLDFCLPIRDTHGGWGGRGDYITPDNIHQFHWAYRCPLWSAYNLLWWESGAFCDCWEKYPDSYRNQFYGETNMTWPRYVHPQELWRLKR